MASQTLPPPEGPEYTPCACGHIEPEHRPDAGRCLVCDCAAYAPAVSGGVPLATDSDALRDRIAAALYKRNHLPGRDPRWANALAMDREEFEALADAVLSVLPAATTHTEREAVLEEAADRFDQHAEQLLDGVGDKAVFVAKALRDQAAVWSEAAETLRRLIAEPAAVGAGAATTPDTEVVAFRSRGGHLLRCLAHTPGAVAVADGEFDAVTSEDLPDGGVCTFPVSLNERCGVDVLIPQKPTATPPAGGAPHPKEA